MDTIFRKQDVSILRQNDTNKRKNAPFQTEEEKNSLRFNKLSLIIS
jgi:hypothetical protein